MSWNIQDRFPTWGEAGESPPDGFFYEGGDQVNEKHLDYLWDNLDALRDDTDAALTDIDSNSDGVVDEADALTSGGSLLGDLNAADGETVWDESENHIPQARLENTAITLNGGDGLKNGTTGALGGSITVDIEPSDFAGDGVKDDGNDNIAVNTSDFVGDGVRSDVNGNIAVEPADFAGTHLSDDGNDNLIVDDDFVLNSGDTINGSLTVTNTLTVDTDASFPLGTTIDGNKVFHAGNDGAGSGLVAESTKKVKGNDIDTDGDGIVDEADTAAAVDYADVTNHPTTTTTIAVQTINKTVFSADKGYGQDEFEHVGVFVDGGSFTLSANFGATSEMTIEFADGTVITNDVTDGTQTFTFSKTGFLQKIEFREAQDGSSTQVSGSLDANVITIHDHDHDLQ